MLRICFLFFGLALTALAMPEIDDCFILTHKRSAPPPNFLAIGNNRFWSGVWIDLEDTDPTKKKRALAILRAKGSGYFLAHNPTFLWAAASRFAISNKDFHIENAYFSQAIDDMGLNYPAVGEQAFRLLETGRHNWTDFLRPLTRVFEVAKEMDRGGNPAEIIKSTLAVCPASNGPTLAAMSDFLQALAANHCTTLEMKNYLSLIQAIAQLSIGIPGFDYRTSPIPSMTYYVLHDVPTYLLVQLSQVYGVSATRIPVPDPFRN